MSTSELVREITREILDVVFFLAGFGLAVYCAIGFFYQWPLSNVIWLAAAFAFLTAGMPTVRR